MTEQPDTTAIRAGIFGNPAKVIYDLCDALDAARAATDFENEMYEMANRRAEAAEARIAAALTFLDKPRGSGFPYARIAHARRALTGTVR